MKKFLLGSLLAAVVAIPLAWAAGSWTVGLPLITAPSLNGVTLVAPGGLYTNLAATGALIPVDTNSAGGAQPQSVAAQPFDVAAVAMELVSNQATSTVHAATLNTVSGFITTEALTTAAGSSYTFNLTNSLLTTAKPAPVVAVHSGTNTAGVFQVVSVTNISGGATIVIKNAGTAAFNGTILIGFHI